MSHNSISPTGPPAAPTATCAVEILLFSVLKDRVGRPSVTLRIATPATVEDVLSAFLELYPDAGPYRRTVRVAVNAQYATPCDPVRDGDEIALITPVSGG